MRKRLLLILAAVAALLVVAVLALPFLIDADQFRPTIEKELQAALGREVKIGKLSLSIWSGGVVAEEITIADDPAFSKQPFLRAKELSVGVEMMPLIFSRSIQARSVAIAEPQIALISNPAGKWNFSSLGARNEKAVASNTPADFSVQEFRITNGRLLVGAGNKQKVYENLEVTAENVGFGSKIPFTVAATTPGGGKLGVEGTAGPLDREDAAQSPLDAKVKIEGMDLGATGFIDPASGIAGTMDYDGTVVSDGKQVKSQGTAKLARLKLVRGGAPASQPVQLDYAAEHDLERKGGQLSKGTISIGKSTANLIGRYDTKPETPVVHLKLTAKQMPVQDVQGVLPALGVTLPAGSSLQGGTANADLNIDGPITRLVTTGLLNLSNAKLAGFNLNQKLSGMSALAGLPSTSDTNIEMMSSKVRIAPEGIRADNLQIAVANLGTVTGGGTIGSDSRLNFKMQAKLAGGGGALGAMSALSTLGQSKGAIPFLIQGTTNNPVFLPDVAGAVGNTVTAPAEGVGGLFQGLFGKKKKTQ